MSSPERCAVILALLTGLSFTAQAQTFGRPATADDIQLWTIDVRPDGTDLPVGRGTVSQGKAVYEAHCLGCHGHNGAGGYKNRLAGGIGSLTSDAPVKTVGSFWPYATTLFDYVHRAMPYYFPGSLGTSDTYAVVAYILNLNGIVAADAAVDQVSLPKIQMPNRNGFVPDPEYIDFKASR